MMEGSGSVPTSDKRIQIREAQKHPDPEHWLVVGTGSY